MDPKNGLFREDEVYPVYLSDTPINENDPFYIRKMEEAIKSLEEAPLPDFLLKRMMGKD